jgi:hypothetical protein
MPPTEINPAIKRPLLSDLCRAGYFFCLICERVCDVEEYAGYYRCGTCHSFQVNWNAPAFPSEKH